MRRRKRRSMQSLNPYDSVELSSDTLLSLKSRELQLEKQKEILRARKSILAFTQWTKPDYKINWYHRNLCEKLDAFIRGDIRFLMVFMPPRHGKSELVSRRLP